jgi:hypothetical protein
LQPHPECFFRHDDGHENASYVPAEVLWDNVSAAMRLHWGKENLTRLGKEAGIGPGGATRLKQQKTSVGLDVLARVAILFDLHPFHLLLPNLDPANPPVMPMTPQEQEFYATLKTAFKRLQSAA